MFKRTRELRKLADAAQSDVSVWDVGVSCYSWGSVIWINGVKTVVRSSDKRQVMDEAARRLVRETRKPRRRGF